MPKYELMYIVGNEVSDNDIPKVVEEVKKYISDFGGSIDKYEEIGKKRMSYPIKKSRNGYYVLAQFECDSKQIKEIEKRLQTNLEIIRHLVINIDEGLRRMEKDRKAQAKMKPRQEDEEVKPGSTKPRPTIRPSRPVKKIEIDLDAEIEKALESEDLK